MSPSLPPSCMAMSEQGSLLYWYKNMGLCPCFMSANKLLYTLWPFWLSCSLMHLPVIWGIEGCAIDFIVIFFPYLSLFRAAKINCQQSSTPTFVIEQRQLMLRNLWCMIVWRLWCAAMCFWLLRNRWITSWGAFCLSKVNWSTVNAWIYCDTTLAK